MSLHLTCWKILGQHKGSPNLLLLDLYKHSSTDDQLFLGGWGQFAKVTDIGFERHSAAKNID